MTKNAKVCSYVSTAMLAASLVGCNPFGPSQARVVSPDQVYRHGNTELAFSAVIDHTFQEGMIENANTFRLLLDINGENVIDETFQTWEGERSFNGSHQDVPIVATCTQHPVNGKLTPEIYCRTTVGQHRAVTLVFTHAHVPAELVTHRDENTPPKGVTSPPAQTSAAPANRAGRSVPQ